MKNRKFIREVKREDAIITNEAQCTKCAEVFVLAYPLSVAVKFLADAREGKIKCEKCASPLRLDAGVVRRTDTDAASTAKQQRTNHQPERVSSGGIILV